MSIRKLFEELKKKDWRAHSRSITLNHNISDFGKEFRKNTIAMIVSALGLVAALMWQDAIKTWINNIIPTDDPKNYLIKIYAAVIVTFIAVIGIYLLSKLIPRQ